MSKDSYTLLLQESVDHSLLNLLTYPWIEQKVAKGELSVHGGYYDFVDCTFEKWTLDYKGSNLGKNSRLPVKNRFYWCWTLLLVSLYDVLLLFLLILLFSYFWNLHRVWQRIVLIYRIQHNHNLLLICIILLNNNMI